MTLSEAEFWLEAGKLAASMATPVVVVIIGVLLLDRVEGIKATVATQSSFHQKWAEQYFECCQKFMQAMERELALLTFISSLGGPNDGYIGLRAELEKEVNQLHPTLSELELRIKRSVIFAPLAGDAVKGAASECITLTHALLTTKRGNVDDIISKMNEFNIASRKAHAEMLGLNAV